MPPSTNKSRPRRHSLIAGKRPSVYDGEPGGKERSTGLSDNRVCDHPTHCAQFTASRCHDGPTSPRPIQFALAAIRGGSFAFGQEDKAAEKAAPPAATTHAPPEKAAEEPDPFAVPDGNVEELFRYIDELPGKRPRTGPSSESFEYRQKLGQALVEAAEKIVAAKPAREQLRKALEIKLAALAGLSRIGDKDAVEKLEALPGELEKAGLDDLARRARNALLTTRVSGLRIAPPEERDRLVAEVKAFLGEGRHAEDVRLAMENRPSPRIQQQGNGRGPVLQLRRYRKSGDKLLADQGEKMKGCPVDFRGQADA